MGRVKYKTYPATFPYEITVVENGVAKRGKITEGFPVACIFCGEWFELTPQTAFFYDHPYDTAMHVQCPYCEKKAYVGYFADNLVNNILGGNNHD